MLLKTYILHKLFADRPDVLAQSGAEHHDLLVMRGHFKDLLHVRSHVNLLQHLVALVKHKVLYVLQVECARTRQRKYAARRADHNVRAVLFDRLLVLFDAHTAKEHAHLGRGHVLAESLVLLADLKRQLSCVTHDKHGHLAVDNFELLQRGQHKHGRLAHARLGLADHVHAQNRLRYTFVLHFII